MTVGDLIKLLEQHPKDLPIVYSKWSEYTLLTAEEISVAQLQKPRADGWVHEARPDKPTVSYLAFPGN